MNIKAVYNKSMHKLSSGVTTLAEIRLAIKNIYKDKLPENFTLYVLIDPYNDQLAKVETEDQLEQVRLTYKANDWPSIKVLVQDSAQDQINQNDLDLLNQSMSLNRSQMKPKESKQSQSQDMGSFQDAQQQKQQQLQTDFKSQQTDLQEQKDVAHQFQQTRLIENETKETQSGVSTKETGQNPLNLALDISIPGVDSHHLQEYIKQLIDQRLRHHGLIQDVQQKVEPTYKFVQTLQSPPLSKQDSLEIPVVKVPSRISQKIQFDEDDVSVRAPVEVKEEVAEIVKPIQNPEMFLKEASQVRFTVKEHEEFEWTVTILNKGKQTWPDTVTLRCIDGYFKGKVVELLPLGSNKTQQITQKFTAHEALNQATNDFKLFFIDQENQVKSFGQKISFELNVTPAPQIVDEQKQSIQCSNKNVAELQKRNQMVLAKANEIKGVFPQVTLEKIIAFIHQCGIETSVDELIENCLSSDTFTT